jgi:hypothetical protein
MVLACIPADFSAINRPGWYAPLADSHKTEIPTNHRTVRKCHHDGNERLNPIRGQFGSRAAAKADLARTSRRAPALVIRHPYAKLSLRHCFGRFPAPYQLVGHRLAGRSTKGSVHEATKNAPVAQLDRASVYGTLQVRALPGVLARFCFGRWTLQRPKRLPASATGADAENLHGSQ